jgi:hypothetical protein
MISFPNNLIPENNPTGSVFLREAETVDLMAKDVAQISEAAIVLCLRTNDGREDYRPRASAIRKNAAGLFMISSRIERRSERAFSA